MRLNNNETLARIEVILALSDKDLGQLRLFSNPATPTPLGFLPSFDHLIRSIQHRLWNRQADLLCRLEINHQLELGRLLHRKISRLGAFKDSVHVSKRRA